MNPYPGFRPGARLLAALAVALILLPAVSTSLSPVSAQEAEELGVNSAHYIVVDSGTGEVYAQRDADDRVAIGSLTKIFTVIEAMDIAPLDTVITTDASDIKDPASNSIMGFDVGEELTLEELLYGLMLPSGNDAAHAVARSLGYRDGDTDPQQSVDRFMGWINQRILDMGLTDTHLITPDGWGVPGHYTTAHDLAAFTRYAVTHPFFVTLISSAEYTTAEGNTIYNNNRLLGMYDDLVGGKTGYDWDAGWCLVEVAERDGMQMISVTLDGVHENMDWYDDNEVLLEYGFEQRSPRIDDSLSTWDGSLAQFANPAVAMIDRSTAASAAIGGQPAVTGTTSLAATTDGTTDQTDGTTAIDVAAVDPAADQQAVPEAAVLASPSTEEHHEPGGADRSGPGSDRTRRTGGVLAVSSGRWAVAPRSGPCPGESDARDQPWRTSVENGRGSCWTLDPERESAPPAVAPHECGGRARISSRRATAFSG